MPPISLLIKPASGNCNMNCRYCFYADEMSHREVGSYGVMKQEVLEAVIRKALTFADRQASFGFQGGEPTLSGLDFFRNVVEAQKRYYKAGVTIHNNIQSSQTLQYRVNHSSFRFVVLT